MVILSWLSAGPLGPTDRKPARFIALQHCPCSPGGPGALTQSATGAGGWMQGHILLGHPRVGVPCLRPTLAGHEAEGHGWQVPLSSIRWGHRIRVPVNSMLGPGSAVVQDYCGGPNLHESYGGAPYQLSSGGHCGPALFSAITAISPRGCV